MKCASVLLMFITGGLLFMSCSKNEELIAATPVTEMQKLMAEKAFGNSYDKETVKKWLTTFCRRFFAQQFKRSCLPDGPKVGSISLSPRGDWRMPSDASSALWLHECDEL